MPEVAPRPLISRETRRLLITIMVSLAALWVLARMRFQDRAVTPDPVPPVLAQLGPRASFENLSGEVSELRPRVVASVIALGPGRAALRVRSDAGLALDAEASATWLARDGASGIGILRVPGGAVAPLAPWAPRRLDFPRYLIAADASRSGISLRPVFVGALFPTVSPIWPDKIWGLPPHADLVAGTFVFSTEGTLAGLVVEHDGGRAIVPGDAILRASDRLFEQGEGRPGEIGVTVQPLSADVAAAGGATAGMVIVWVDPNGPAAGRLWPTQIVEAIDGDEVTTADHWRARIGRLQVGDVLALRVRAGGAVSEVSLMATPRLEPQSEPALGLRLRSVPRLGAEVLEVQPGSAAARAGLVPGDIITVIGETHSPTPAQIARAFTAIPAGSLVLVAVTHGDAHRVLTVGK